MKIWTMLIVLPLFSVTALSQENTRQVDGSGKFSKYLTPGQLDSWVIDGEKGETIIALFPGCS